MQVNADLSQLALVRHADLTYVASPSAGVSRGMLSRDGDEVARATTLVRYAPDTSFPPHVHAAGEDFLVLEGTFADDLGRYPTGTFVRNEIGSVHAPSIGPDGCLILVNLRWFEPEDTNALVDTTTPTAAWTTAATGAVYVNLYTSAATGERSWTAHLPPGASLESFPGHEGGQELFVIDGEASIAGSWTGALQSYDWLRLPPAFGQVKVTNPSATKTTRLIFKTNHLARFLK